MTKVSFLFDIIVTRLELTNFEVENPEKLSVMVKFNKIGTNITSSRINVSDFPAGRRAEFTTAPDVLRQTLLKDAVPITVLYSGLSVGAAEVMFSESFSNRIDYGMSDTIHAETCSIFARNEQEVGTMDLLFYLTIKCEQKEYEQGEEEEQANELTSCANLGKVINPADIMFVVGAPQPYPIPSLGELMPEEGDERLRLDLDRYRSNNQRVVEPPNKMCGTNASCQLKVLTKQCEDFINVVIRQVSRLTSPMPDEQPLFTQGQRNTYKHKIVENTIPVPVRYMEKVLIKPIRFCPLCLNSMSWLPKYAHCPKCWAKPMPQLEKEPEEKLTAYEIIQQYVKSGQKTASGVSDKTVTKKSKKSRCTCTLHKICAHCRVLKTCADIFKPPGWHQKVEPINHDDYCIILKPEGKSSTKCRPHIERVFSELQIIYDTIASKKLRHSNNLCKRPLSL